MNNQAAPNTSERITRNTFPTRLLLALGACGAIAVGFFCFRSTPTVTTAQVQPAIQPLAVTTTRPVPKPTIRRDYDKFENITVIEAAWCTANGEIEIRCSVQYSGKEPSGAESIKSDWVTYMSAHSRKGLVPAPLELVFLADGLRVPAEGDVGHLTVTQMKWLRDAKIVEARAGTQEIALFEDELAKSIFRQFCGVLGL